MANILWCMEQPFPGTFLSSVCVYCWFAFVPPKTAQDPTKRISHNVSKTLGITCHIDGDRVAKNLRGKNSMEWWDFKLSQRWLLQGQSAPLSRSVEMEWFGAPINHGRTSNIGFLGWNNPFWGPITPFITGFWDPPRTADMDRIDVEAAGSSK